jgi:uncharacterized protein YndB with AHSA1/START domain
MSGISSKTARAAADVSEGYLLATVELEVPPDRVFEALTSPIEIVDWWVRPGVFDTREWTGELQPQGKWRASGIGNGRPYVLEGEFVEIDRPHKLVHTWRVAAAPLAPTTVTYLLEPLDPGTRVTLRHSGFNSRDVCIATCIGWETSFARLAELLTPGK